MKVRFVTSRTCQGEFNPATLAAGNVKTVLGAKRLRNRAIKELARRYLRHSPNYPFYAYIDGVRMGDNEMFLHDDEIVQALSRIPQ